MYVYGLDYVLSNGGMTLALQGQGHTIRITDHANTSCHAMTLTFDPLTLNFCGTSGIMCSNSVQNMSEIEHSAAELLMI